jgi:hypothetical protein
VVNRSTRSARIGFMDKGVFIQYIIRKAVIVFITAFLGDASRPAPSLKRGNLTIRRGY